MKARRLFSRRLVSIMLLCVFVCSLGTQTTQAFDYKFYSGNDIIWSNPDDCSTSSSTSSSTDSLTGNDNKEKIWNFLTTTGGLTPEQAAGVMGNLQQESTYNGIPFNPEALNAKSGAYGLVQWLNGRLDGLKKAAADKGVPVSDLLFQLNYMVQESEGRIAKKSYGGGSEWEGLKGERTVEDALFYWYDNNERAGESRQVIINTRGKFAQAIYNELNGKTTQTSAPTSTSGGANKTVVFIDPGHGGQIPRYTDPQSGLVATENHNMPESADAIEVAKQVETALKQAGYEVVLSHKDPDAMVKFRDRSTAAENAKAAIAVSIHTTDGEINQVWPQRMDTYRQYGSHKDTFTNQATATKSEQYANIMARTRTAAEGHPVTTDPGNKQQASSFSRPDIESKGNISLVQLWAQDIPWVYNEIARDEGLAITKDRKAAYAKGIADGIKEAVPVGAASNKNACSGASNFNGGDLIQTMLAYAWPQYHPAPYTNKKPEYETAVNKARSEGRYVGGLQYPGVDCGGFVTTLMVDSGFEPNYNHAGKISQGAGTTTTQRAWAESNWNLLKRGSEINPADLRPGDVAFSPGHTFVYVGSVPNFDSHIASASVEIWRSPMAGHESITASDVTWYRKK